MAGFRYVSYYVTITFLVRSIQIYKVGTLVHENSHQGVTRGSPGRLEQQFIEWV